MMVSGVVLVLMMIVQWPTAVQADGAAMPALMTNITGVQVVDHRNSDRNKYYFSEKALISERALLEYTRSKVDQFNLDGMVGLRMAQGQMLVLLRRVGDSIPTEIRDEIYNLAELAKEIIERAVPFINASTPDYYKQMGVVISEGFFEHNYDMRKTNSSLVYPDVKIKDKFSEFRSDSCLSQLQGTGEYEGHPCTVSDDCWDLMTAANYKGYALTHQVLYLLVGESMQCGEEIKVVNEKFCREYGRCHTVLELQDILCSNVLDGMKGLEATGFPGNTQDLFMEQIALCGILGFRDVCPVHWLKLIRSWQQPSGCYVRTDMHLYRRNRQKRYDVFIDDGCSSHKTSVAAGALGVCIRFHTEDPILMSSDG